MFIKPTVAIDNGWIKGKFTDDNVQPNAIDFTLDKLFTINHNESFFISNTTKLMRGGYEVMPDPCFPDYWMLAEKSSYDAMSDFYVEVPEGVACMLIIRSSFNRNGIFLTSGLYDSGYKGHIGFAIHNNSGAAYIAPGTRIGQIIFVQSESAKVYAGGWNHEEGTTLNHHQDVPIVPESGRAI